MLKIMGKNLYDIYNSMLRKNIYLNLWCCLMSFQEHMLGLSLKLTVQQCMELMEKNIEMDNSLLCFRQQRVVVNKVKPD